MLTNKILLIDDDPEELELLVDAISQVDRNIDCVGASNCKEGFEKLNSSDGLPRYIFLDLNMRPFQGKDCLKQIKTHPVYSSIPVFIYTASNQESDMEETRKLGAQMFITKPDSMKDLKKVLSYIVSEEWKYNR
jgi:CheY-like chemotaxis protein